MITFIKNEEERNDGGISLNISSLVGKEHTFNIPPEDPTPKKTRKKRAVIDGVESVTREDDIPDIFTNTPYKESYNETDSMLKDAIMQIDIAAAEIRQDIGIIRSSRTMKKKYDYLALMHGSFGQLIGNKISAARELNNSIKHSHDLEFKRNKEFKINDQVDDTKAVMDTYSAFVNMPVSSTPLQYSTPLGPDSMDLTLASHNVIARAVGANPDIGYQNYLNNLTPEQAMMMHEDNPDIKQVVIYNQDTFDKSFEVMNMQTGEIMHGLPKRSNRYMEDTTIDLENKIARNINLDEVYDVVVVGKGDMANY